MEHFFVVLGGMGTMATESFVHQLNNNTIAHQDQDYLNYLVVNHASVPDRTAYILDQSLDNPADYLLQDIQQMEKLEPDFFVMTCNTAHYFYDLLQQATNIPIKHMPKITLEAVAKNAEGRQQRVMILATSGTIQSEVYTKEFAYYDNLEPVIPNDKLQDEVMTLIYQDIKENNYLNLERMQNILQQSLEDYDCQQVILGCTELSLMNDKYPLFDLPIVDAQLELVKNIIAEYKNKP